MLRPLLLEYPKDLTARNQELSCMIGGSLLIAPPFERERYSVYLPAGKWADMGTGEILPGGGYLELQPKLDELPVFQKENSWFFDSRGKIRPMFHRSLQRAERNAFLFGGDERCLLR